MRATNPNQRKNAKICRVLRLLRFVLGYSQADLNRLLKKEYGLDVNISDMERGASRPSIDLLYAFENLTGVPAWAICWLSEDDGYYLPPDANVIKGAGYIKLEFCPPIVQGLSLLVNLSEAKREQRIANPPKKKLQSKNHPEK